MRGGTNDETNFPEELWEGQQWFWNIRKPTLPGMVWVGETTALHKGTQTLSTLPMAISSWGWLLEAPQGKGKNIS